MAPRDDVAGSHESTSADWLVHVAIIVAITAVHALLLPTLTLGLHIPLAAPAANGPRIFGTEGFSPAVLFAFGAYLPFDALTYVLLALIAYATDVERLRRTADLNASALRAELSASRLSALRAQLRPHFFLNALNSAAVLAKRGDAILAQALAAES